MWVRSTLLEIENIALGCKTVGTFGVMDVLGYENKHPLDREKLPNRSRELSSELLLECPF